MVKYKRVSPLASGLLVSESDFILGQLELSLVDYMDIEVTIKRKPYGGSSDVKLSLTKKALHCMIEILQEAERKLDECWLSELALEQAKASRKS